VEVQIGPEVVNVVKIGATLPSALQDQVTCLLQDNFDFFAWMPADMPGVDPRFGAHKLSIMSGYKPVAQKKHHMGPERQKAIEEQTKDLLQVGFIKRIHYATLLSNVMMVKKANGK
jgi:hypothetical protein